MNIFTPSFKKKLDELHATVAQAEDELKRLRKVYTKFTDLQVHRDERGVERYYSKEANSIVNQVSIQLDSNNIKLIARPLIVYGGFNIYSDPLEFYIADHGSFWHRYNFHSNWKQELVSNNINGAVIELVKDYEKHFGEIPKNKENISEGNE